MPEGWTTGPRFAALAAILLLAAATAHADGRVRGAASPSPAAPVARVAGLASARAPDPDVAARPAPARTPQSRPGRRDTADFRASVVRTGIAFAGLLVFGAGLVAPGLRSGRAARWRAVLLVALALSAYASYYQFFRLGHPEGFATSDNFHYYVGSKYFPELGYYGLYACSMIALEERGVRVPSGPEPRARDLHSMEIWPAPWVRKRGTHCAKRFTPERWQSFSRDVGWFVEKWPPHIRNAVWVDHGYHPSPVWTLFGATVTSLAPTQSRTAMRALARTDRVIIAVTLGLVTWAFGLEVGCLAAILWGTGHLWRYAWIGDAFLRHLWWSAAFLGIAALRRGAPAVGGAGLAAAALLRLFPGALGLAYVLGALRGAAVRGAVRRAPLRFAIGAGVASVVLIGLALSVIGEGVVPLIAFVAKIGEFASVSATNKMGLGAIAARVFPDSAGLALALRAAGAIAFAALFWRALRDALPYEAAAFGFALIPWATDPTNYYYSFFVLGAVLAARRPLVGMVLLATGVAWGINGMVFYRDYVEFPAASVIALLSTVAVAAAMTRPPGRPAARPAAS